MLGRIALVVLASVSVACGPVAALFEPSPTDLLHKATANMQAGKTAHVEGTGTFALKDGMSLSFDFKMSGDAELPSRARLSIQMSLLGQSLSVDSITVDGKTYTRGMNGQTWTLAGTSDPTSAMLDPFGQADLSAVTSIKEVDRLEVDGKKARHLSYSVDTSKMLDKMKTSAGAASFKASNVSALGEVWIRTEDTQIVRQLLKIGFDIEGDLGLGGGATPASTGKGQFEMSFDMKFSRLGEPLVPAITAPPTR